MTLFQAFILGIVQGLTEFLPISSSGHLVLVPYLLGWQFPKEQVFIFDVLVQVGTLAGVIAYFWKDLVKLVVGFFQALFRKDWRDTQFRLAINLVIASIPAALAGLLIKDFIESTFHDPGLTGIFLFCTAGLLVIAEKVGKRRKEIEQVGWLDALVIGIGQMLAVFPGVSRSGATITGAMLRDLKRDDAARFSFILSIPAMLGAGVLSLLDIGSVSGLSSFIPALLVGMITSAVVGYLAIFWLLRFLRSRTLYPFVWYCLGLGTLILLTIYVF